MAGSRQRRSRRGAGALTLRAAGRFLYAQVAEELRRRIVQGVYGPGSRIPSEADLVREFQVSAITVRRTVRDLQFEGLLVGRQGLGVFVSDKRRIRRSLSADVTTPLRDEMRRAGVEPGVKVIALSGVPGDEETRRRLGLVPGTVPLLYRLETLILADGEPVGLDTTYFHQELGDALQSELSREFIYPLFVSRGIAVDHMDFAIEGDAVRAGASPATRPARRVPAPDRALHRAVSGRGRHSSPDGRPRAPTASRTSSAAARSYTDRHPRPSCRGREDLPRSTCLNQIVPRGHRDLTMIGD